MESMEDGKHLVGWHAVGIGSGHQNPRPSGGGFCVDDDVEVVGGYLVEVWGAEEGVLHEPPTVHDSSVVKLVQQLKKDRHVQEIARLL